MTGSHDDGGSAAISVPDRPYTLIYAPAPPRGLELRLLRSALPEAGVVLEIARPDEPLGGGRMIRVNGWDLDRIFSAAKATADLNPGDEEARRRLAATLVEGGTECKAVS